MQSRHRLRPMIDGRETRHLIEADIDHGLPFVSRDRALAAVIPPFLLVRQHP